MRRFALLAIAVLTLAGCAGGSGSPPLTQTSPAPAGATTPATKAPAAASTCDIAREALLTGTPADITAAMTALIADKAAPAIAREYASYYVDRDKDNKDLQTMDASLIRTACPS